LTFRRGRGRHDFSRYAAVLSEQLSVIDPQSTPDRTRSRLRAALVIVQVTVSVVLMVGAVLLFRSVHNSARIDLPTVTWRDVVRRLRI